MKTGIVLLNMGGPDGLPAVKPFLYNLFSDPDIIRLPFSEIFQKPLAWWIATSRAEEARHNYSLMPGGRSPLLQASRDQADALHALLQKDNMPDVKLYVAMRYWHPFTDIVVEQIKRDGIEHLIALPLYPHFSYTTTGSSLNELKRQLVRQNVNLKLSVVTEYHQHPLYLQAMAETMRQAMDSHCWECPAEEIQVLFSAHSLPLKHIKRTGDPYPDQIRQTATALMETYFPENPWEIAYQSKVGNMPWLGPSTDGVLHYFAGKNRDNILVVPISFVSEHIETLVEIDQQYLPIVADLGIRHCHRAPALNTHPAYIRTLADLSLKELQTGPAPEKAAL